MAGAVGQLGPGDRGDITAATPHRHPLRGHRADVQLLPLWGTESARGTGFALLTMNVLNEIPPNSTAFRASACCAARPSPASWRRSRGSTAGAAEAAEAAGGAVTAVEET